MALQGIDVSEYQGEIDWKKVGTTEAAFTFIKATEGALSSDALFAQNWARSKAAGMIRGAYHFFVATRDPIVQANNFLKVTQGLLEAGDLPPVLDLEKDYGLAPKYILDSATQWLSTVEKATGRRPIIYTYPSFWANNLSNSTRLADYPLWIAHFQTDNPWVPGGWKTWTFHQYTESGSIHGIGGPIDRNFFNGSLDDLQKLLKGKVTLRLGARGQAVLELQKALKGQGYDPGNPDGSFGEKTKTAVITLQKAKKLQPDGIVGPLTWAALAPVAPPNPNPPTPAPTEPLTLVQVCKTYKGQPQQDAALQWLQAQAPAVIWEEFTKRWQ